MADLILVAREDFDRLPAGMKAPPPPPPPPPPRRAPRPPRTGDKTVNAAEEVNSANEPCWARKSLVITVVFSVLVWIGADLLLGILLAADGRFDFSQELAWRVVLSIIFAVISLINWIFMIVVGIMKRRLMYIIGMVFAGITLATMLIHDVLMLMLMSGVFMKGGGTGALFYVFIVIVIIGAIMNTIFMVMVFIALGCGCKYAKK